MIDEKLSWEPHIEHLVSKLNMIIVMPKRITKFIPKSEYRKLYDALFKSHMNYCISSWGGVSESKLQSIFTFKKDVYDFYLVKSFHLIMLGIMKHVREFVLIKSRRHQKITAWSTLNRSLMSIKY